MDDSAANDVSRFNALRQQNPDCVGWVAIADTPLDLPVMYKPDSPNYYLRRGFDGQYSVYGVPYLDENCTFTADRQSENLILYGHHMKTGTIFGSLHDYKNGSYYAAHPYVELDIIYGMVRYRVFAAFAIDIANDDSFLYNQYTDMDEDTYADYVNKALERSSVDTGLRPAYGQQLLTLSTCDYSFKDGRFVVVAYREEA